ncbi:DUF2213 domain-containing protein [Pseudomonas sp. NPDC098747]|uniref:DUF2213 domain-containing protein n=1 Tax=Pseudomonas sp. NPDC098747 TaxID=3364487 RepID=UPI00383B3DD6
MQVRTLDETGRWFAPEQLSERQRMTPEGFLLCEAVPIARTGTLIYDESEVPVEGGSGGQVMIERNADEVFRPETLASFEGKPVTLLHPDDFVNPDNWRELTMGVTQNVRRGEGIESDLMLADLLITDAKAIELIRKTADGSTGRPIQPMRQVSCGYDADYEQLARGRGRQTNIVGNHVALVERGRCGSRCAIGDEMKTTDTQPPKRTFADRLRAAFMSKDSEAAEALAKEAETVDEGSEPNKAKTADGATLDALKDLTEAVATLSQRVGDMEAKKTEPTKDSGTVVDDDDSANSRTNDSGELADVLSRAEILSPGISFATKDAKAKTVDHICSCQRQALAKAMQTEDGAAAVAPFLFGRELSTFTNDQVSAAFMGASELAKTRNNSITTRSTISTKDFGRAPLSPTEINKRNQEYWGGQGRG